MEAPQIVLPGEVHPVRNSSHCDSKPSGALNPAFRGGTPYGAEPGINLKCNPAAQQRGIISNGVNIISYCAPDSAPCRPVRGFGVLDFKMKSEMTVLF
jgi:hypothetical protein